MREHDARVAGHLLSRHVLSAWPAPASGQAAPLAVSPPDAVTSWRWQGVDPSLGPVSSLRVMLERGAAPLCAALGFAPPDRVVFSETMVAASLGGGPANTLLIVVPWGHPLMPASRAAAPEGWQRCARWALLFNGTHLRLTALARGRSRRYCEIPLDESLALEPQQRILQLVFSAGALAARVDGRSRLDDIIDVSDRHAADVCRALRDGVLDASALVLRALLGRTPSQLANAFDQSLVIVYRLLFLLFAEARALVPLWHPVYRESYSVTSLCAAAAAGRTTGLWDGLRAISRLAHNGCRAGTLHVAPFNGRLFSPARTPFADRRDLDDVIAGKALLALTTTASDSREGRQRISFRDLGVEQLGAVYETLLDYQPRVEGAPAIPAGARHRGSAWTVTLTAGGGLRKSTGSFYTPQPIADYLVRRALDPLVREATADGILSLRVLDPSMGSGAFLVSACRFLADAYVAALIRAGGYHPGDFGPADHARIRRRIAEQCLYGVDLNPMAVQLAQLSLWLTTLAADRPLSFLDHHLVAGDSLIGAWVSALRHAPVRPRVVDRRLPLFDDQGLDAAVGGALPVRFRLAQEPNDSADQVRAKERALAALREPGTPLTKWKRVADLWCAAWFSRDLVTANTFGALADAVVLDGGALPRSTARTLLRDVEALAQAHRFFHWELEFPEVFFNAGGTRRADAGFDAILGNPPWDMVRADAGAGREMRGEAALVRFTRDAGAYAAQSRGHANRYQMFLERALALLRPGGRLGLVMPAGLATDQGSAALRRLLFSRCAVDDLIGFENRRAIFPIHRSVRFLLLSATAGRETERIPCRFGETGFEAIERVDAAPVVVVTPALLARVSGDDLAIPDLRSPADLQILEQVTARFAPVSAPESWGARFGRELNATEDRVHFTAGRRGLPVVAGRQIEPFQVRIDAKAPRIAAPRAAELLGRRHQHPRLAYRDVASATNRVTLIAALLPAGCVSTHTLFVLRTSLDVEVQSFLCALFNSLVVNYLARLRVISHVTTAIVERLPVPGRGEAAGDFPILAAAARRLRRGPDTDVMARVNARVARLYGLDRAQFEHVLGTFPLVPASERQMAVRAFANP